MAERTAMLSLYRSLLRLHSKCGLSPEMKELGNSYVKSEFREHKNVTQPNQIQQFVKEWQMYKQQMEQRQTASSKYGQNLPSDVELSEEQQNQLGKLREEARNIGTSSTTDKE
uniref:Succinate dehydrogenase assembly factor 3 n=1 Tax=Eucampia antarctica TaxID=49252 RepID=A0A6U0S7K8_9STRA|eukprot:CAMPEP_0197827214 /NCGR_PEP_ID=MMETSP1437-20131217/4043_1 /TAXON_ID=49252 ORGANISM="Eucampia antarctica, Strain CCMP1452" /NCGR_SAMPLE_ID=MMETSP1437 /ASSEMBLY_ACC=CAM_ASM_001096 /LENGTH=112 /DNA_ID=CAMNT_0043427973 /DNA_START=25 /DNA_END=363 /DNA_ORIENTATION=+